jgi:hypothetical protein
MKEKTQYKRVTGIFVNQSDSKWRSDWVMDTNKLAQLTSEDFANMIKKVFEEMQGGFIFNAQVIEVSGFNSQGDEFRYFEVSLGHSIFSHHYRYYPKNNKWIHTIINQEFFEKIVQPFQRSLNWK